MKVREKRHPESFRKYYGSQGGMNMVEKRGAVTNIKNCSVMRLR